MAVSESTCVIRISDGESDMLPVDGRRCNILLDSRIKKITVCSMVVDFPEICFDSENRNFVPENLVVNLSGGLSISGAPGIPLVQLPKKLLGKGGIITPNATLKIDQTNPWQPTFTLSTASGGAVSYPGKITMLVKLRYETS